MSRIYHILPLETGGWKIVTNRSDSSANEHSEQEDAIEHARDLALKDKGAHIIVHTPDGTIQKKMSFGNE